ncbi:nuclease, putative [Toxoplasma gondii ME49]|uniref:Nuclease, putative n=2 Tax=Toxoplasma gondii TaxID=5811 RepID=S8EUQ1_TOXGM|nr:nuclease, putative [Toxoplasma gondii ME49]EPT27166.1 nuclease, putative [Toxoplasma gondii ME49]KFG45322.1 putative nuclease [Toxoplasma gondii GAB2-2007-GAL-DOM2]|eukprot:XP_002366323.1 nuclease, putative [Toxoplasma gondii ME49]
MGCTESKAKEPRGCRRQDSITAPEKHVPAPFCLPFSPQDFYTGAELLSTEADIGDAILDHQLCIVGRCVNVSDGDSIRVRHIPKGHTLYPLRAPRKRGETREPVREPSDEEDPSKCWKGKLTENTIRIRLYGIDAPETAKFGNPGQPFAQEAKHFVTQRLLHKVVYVKCLAKDQYGRLLARVLIPRPDGLSHALFRGVSDAKEGEVREPCDEKVDDRDRFIICLMRIMLCRPVKGVRQSKKDPVQGAPSWWCDDVCEELLMEGLACLYRGRGADYCDQRPLLANLESRAKEQKLGLWSAEDGELQLPGEYKKSTRAGLLAPEADNDACSNRRGSRSRRRKSRSRSPSPAGSAADAECFTKNAGENGREDTRQAGPKEAEEPVAEIRPKSRRGGRGGRSRSKSRNRGEKKDEERDEEADFECTAQQHGRKKKRNRKRRASAEPSEYVESS